MTVPAAVFSATSTAVTVLSPESSKVRAGPSFTLVTLTVRVWVEVRPPASVTVTSTEVGAEPSKSKAAASRMVISPVVALMARAAGR